MRLLGRDITPAKVMAYVEERLVARGLASSPPSAGVTVEGVEARVDPLTFNLQALEENADATRGLPLETHRDGLAGRAVILAKQVFRRAGQLFINEALGRQRVFNGHVRDSYAQLSAEVMRLRARVAELEREAAGGAAEVRKPTPPTPPAVEPRARPTSRRSAVDKPPPPSPPRASASENRKAPRHPSRRGK